MAKKGYRPLFSVGVGIAPGQKGSFGPIDLRKLAERRQLASQFTS
jgi:hypothetical protein